MDCSWCAKQKKTRISVGINRDLSFTVLILPVARDHLLKKKKKKGQFVQSIAAFFLRIICI